MPPSTPPQPPPAGWYPDPEDAEGLRWWNGSQWTDLLVATATPAHLADAADSVQDEEISDPAALMVLRCDSCNQRRDSRIEVCKNCGGSAATIDPDAPRAGGVIFSTDDVLDVPATPGLLVERMVALRQERAILDGAEMPPSAALLRQELEGERSQWREELNAKLQAQRTTGPYSTGKWEANPFGLSGRVIRGYRHWRRKR